MKNKRWLTEIPPEEYMLDCDEWHHTSDEATMNYPASPLRSFNGRLIHQQFTGVKDSNGKDIYEGDILKETWKENYPYGYNPDEWTDEYQMYVVKYEAPAFTFVIASHDHVCRENFRRIVVGNIFENPILI